MGFIRSLVTDEASQFSETITNNLSLATNAVDPNISGAGEIVENAIGQVPDMILPEDAGSPGSQFVSEVSDIAPTQALSNAARNTRSAFSRTPALSNDIAQEAQALGNLPDRRDILPTQEIMRRKLNHFQIERLAEQIKERLESEMKVEKERRGEEP